MAEVFGHGGEAVPESGAYECSQCGERRHFSAGETFPPNHHEGHPWTLYVRDESSPEHYSGASS